LALIKPYWRIIITSYRLVLQVLYEVSGKFSVALKAIRTPLWLCLCILVETVSPHLGNVCVEADLDTRSRKTTNWRVRSTSLGDSRVCP
jgi:hypothetical protein